MHNYPLRLSQKEDLAGNRIVCIKDASNNVIMFGKIPPSNGHYQPATIYADEHEQQILFNLRPDDKGILFDIERADGDSLGVLKVSGNTMQRRYSFINQNEDEIGKVVSDGSRKSNVGLGVVFDKLVGSKPSRLIVHLHGRPTFSIVPESRRQLPLEKINGCSETDEEFILASMFIVSNYVTAD